MGDFRKNPKVPFEVPVPNKIRKRIAMHEVKSLLNNAVQRARLFSRTVDVILGKEAPTRQRGSMWSRFTNRIKKFLR